MSGASVCIAKTEAMAPAPLRSGNAWDMARALARKQTSEPGPRRARAPVLCFQAIAVDCPVFPVNDLTAARVRACGFGREFLTLNALCGSLKALCRRRGR